MKILTIDKLKEISDKWVVEGERIVHEGRPYLIPVNLIRENLYYGTLDIMDNWDDAMIDDTSFTYYTLYEKLKNDGWSSDHPACIVVGKIGEVLYSNGTHRLNMVLNYIPEIKYIPVNINYVGNVLTSPYIIDVVYRNSDYNKGHMNKVSGMPAASKLGHYSATSSFPKWYKKNDN